MRYSFNRSQFENIPLILPPMEIQKKITGFLDRETARIDELIEKREAFLDLISEKKNALTSQAVNGTILGTKHGGETGWFGCLPKDWPIKRGKFLFRERSNLSTTGEEELLTVSHITGVTRRSDKEVNMFLANSLIGYKLVFQGDVVINTMWAWMGAMGVSPIEGLISPSYGVYMPTSEAFEPEYIDLLLRSRSFIAEVNRRSKGVWSSRLRLYPDAFLDILFPVPPKDVQRKILEALYKKTQIEERLANLSHQSLERLREFRSTLIAAAVTGQIDVEHWSRRGDTDRRLGAIEEEMGA